MSAICNAQRNNKFETVLTMIKTFREKYVIEYVPKFFLYLTSLVKILNFSFVVRLYILEEDITTYRTFLSLDEISMADINGRTMRSRTKTISNNLVFVYL